MVYCWRVSWWVANMKIEATGNTEEICGKIIRNKRDAINRNMDVTFSEIRKYGNFELGYKYVQDYKQKQLADNSEER